MSKNKRLQKKIPARTLTEDNRKIKTRLKKKEENIMNKHRVNVYNQYY